MKRMNKLLALLLAVIMVASFAACGNEPAPTPDPEPAPTPAITILTCRAERRIR